MALTVDSAFSQFLKDTVNLDPEETKKARSSRDWLVDDNIHCFPDRINDFPRLYSEKDISFGSFARRTKIRPLDDIDIMICLSADGTTYGDKLGGGIYLTVPEGAKNLRKLCHDGTSSLNSRLVINKFVSALKTVPQYDKADIKRNQEAATLNLKSYAWTFDIVPCFFTHPEYDGRSYYLIPDGSGYWKKTDPRKDRDRVTSVNQRHDGNVLNPIRIMKYWNKRPTMPSMSSYLIENMILDVYDQILILNKASQYVDLEVSKLLGEIATRVMSPVFDPKGIQGDINKLTLDERLKISNRASSDKKKASEASRLESNGDHKAAISLWREIFGDKFPTYG